MLLISLLLLPITGIFVISTIPYNKASSLNINHSKMVALATSLINLVISLIVFIFFNSSLNEFQFVQEYHEVSSFDFYLGVDGLSIYFVLLTTIIMPISLISNWSSVQNNVKSYLIIMLLLETLLLGVFLVLDILLFYIFFESILPPLFLLIGIFGSNNRVRASFYLFLYTLLGSLFLLLSILSMSSIMGTTDFDALYKNNFFFYSQLFLFSGIFIAFAVKTPTIFLNTWLLKAHVESPLGGSIILAAIVLKLSLYGILRLILPLLPKAYLYFTSLIYLIGVITIMYASVSTLRTIDVKELIAYSSVCHAAVYFLGIFSNVIQGIEGAILLGLGHGFVSSGLFICAGGVLYDRSSTRLISFYRGMAQLMPLFSVLFFILCLGNAGTPLSLNFVGEFLSLYGTFERVPLMGLLASSSIVFSAAYTIYMFNRICFAGSFSSFFIFNLPDVSKREFNILLSLVIFAVVLGIYPSYILDSIHYSVTLLLYDSSSLSPGMLFFGGMYIRGGKIRENMLFFLLVLFSIVAFIVLCIEFFLLYHMLLELYQLDFTPLIEWVKNGTHFSIGQGGGTPPPVSEMISGSSQVANTQYTSFQNTLSNAMNSLMVEGRLLTNAHYYHNITVQALADRAGMDVSVLQQAGDANLSNYSIRPNETLAHAFRDAAGNGQYVLLPTFKAIMGQTDPFAFAR